jgi:carnitine O-acetyltransferase
LEPRYGVPINVNPNTLYAKANYKTIDEQLVFATNYICGMIEYKKLIDSQQLPVEKHNTMPLCMDQYYKIFGSCRVPQLKKDMIKLAQPYINAPKHVTVMYKNRVCLKYI